MSGDGSVTRQWGDGERTFRLRIGELRELEQKRDAGSFEIYERLSTGKWRVDDVTEVLRLGLIGAGVPPPLALGLVAKYVTPTNYLGNILVARLVIMTALFGDPGDAVGKLLAETGAASPNPGEPDSRLTSGPVPQWDGPSTPSTDAHFGSSPPPSTDGPGATARARNGSNQ